MSENIYTNNAQCKDEIWLEVSFTFYAKIAVKAPTKSDIDKPEDDVF